MNLSMKWLNDYVNADMPIKEFAAAMTMSGSKVETYRSLCEDIKSVVVAKVIKMEKHTDSEKLWVCQLDIGRGEPIQIVTAAQNVYEGAIVPVVLAGGTIIDRKNKTVVKISKGKLRGVESYGMMCSFEELGMENSDFPYATADGILIFNEDPEIEKFKIGMDVTEAVGINDTVVEFEITNNRPDCLSVLGLAREAHATFNVPFNYKKPEYKGAGGDINSELAVEVKNPQLCSRYMAAMVKNVRIEPSPRWLAERLRASGVRAINNLVDITNFVMLEYGHPMHAFDARYVDGNKIIVRNATENESITLLDGQNIPLSPEMLVICNEKEPMAIAGVMGGRFSGIMEDTSTVIFEAACFNGVSIRRTAKKIGHRTESSSRFEKGIDPINAENALYRALELIEQLGCGEVVSNVIDVDNSNKQPHRLPLDSKWINNFLGANIPEEEQIAILKRLDFGYENGEVIVPNVRIDIERQCDLAEEVARIYGYNNIETTIPRLSSQGRITEEQKFSDAIANVLVAQGCSETMSYSFISPKGYDKIFLDDVDKRSVKIVNPLGEDTSVMRTTLIPSMMEIVARNINNKTSAGRFFEIANEYVPLVDDVNVLPEEKMSVIIAAYGSNEDFFSVKGIVEELLDECAVDAKFTQLRSNKTFHTGRCAEISCEGRNIGVFGEIHPLVNDNYGINQRVYIAKLNVDLLFKCSAKEMKYHSLPKFPATTRDLSLVCAETVSSGEIIEIISGCAKFLEEVSLFDMYQGEQIQAGKKSLSYKLTLRKKDSTITDEEADKTIEKVIAALKEKNIVLRA